MMESRAFNKAVSSLAHPVTVGAVGVMLINDHVLRVIWPSWVTGKLSDAAWLVIVPPLIALLAGWVFRRDEREAGLAAILITGAVFVLIKLTPVAERITTPAGVFGTRADASDLIVLPVLGIAWWVWRRSGERAASWLRWAAIPLAALTLIADAPAPDYGISCLSVENEVIVGSGSYYAGSYSSEDGGLSWQADPGENAAQCSSQSGARQIESPDNPEVVYRFEAGQGIDRSEDGGQTWTREMDFSHDEARTAFVRRDTPYYISGPGDAIFDEQTGNLIVAMGQDGVLVRPPNGGWQWISVGPYHREELDTAAEALSLILGELLLAVFLIPLAVGIFSVRFARRRILAIILAVIATLVWVGAALLSPGLSLGDDYISGMVVGMLVLAGLLALAAGALGVYRFIGANIWLMGIAAGIGVAAAILMALPYLIWVFAGAISYETAMITALVIAGLSVVIGLAVIRRSPAAVSGATEESL